VPVRGRKQSGNEETSILAARWAGARFAPAQGGLCMTATDPGVDVFGTPPFLCIEVLSRRDEAVDLLEKIVEYVRIGVPNIWVIDPHRKKPFIMTASPRRSDRRTDR
jgi:hypothetical protein